MPACARGVAAVQEKEKYDELIGRAFATDKLFVAALNSAFEHFLNLNARSPEYISLFMDDKLRKGLKVRRRQPLGLLVGVEIAACWSQPELAAAERQAAQGAQGLTDIHRWAGGHPHMGCRFPLAPSMVAVAPPLTALANRPPLPAGHV